MPNPQGIANVLVRVHGFYGASSSVETEHWSWGLRIAPVPDLIAAADMQAFADAVRSLVVTHHSAGAPGAGPKCFLKEVTAAHIGTDGFYVGGGTQETTHSVVGSPAAGVGTARHPWSQCLAITLKGDRPRGRASNGRFYLPAAAHDLEDDGLTSTTKQTAIAGAVLTMLNGINTAAESEFLPASNIAIVSQVEVGKWQRATRFGVGRRADAQERRENDIGEGYLFTALS